MPSRRLLAIRKRALTPAGSLLNWRRVRQVSTQLLLHAELTAGSNHGISSSQVLRLTTRCSPSSSTGSPLETRSRKSSTSSQALLSEGPERLVAPGGGVISRVADLSSLRGSTCELISLRYELNVFSFSLLLTPLHLSSSPMTSVDAWNLVCSLFQKRSMTRSTAAKTRSFSSWKGGLTVVEATSVAALSP